MKKKNELVNALLTKIATKFNLTTKKELDALQEAYNVGYVEGKTDVLDAMEQYSIECSNEDSII